MKEPTSIKLMAHEGRASLSINLPRPNGSWFKFTMSAESASELWNAIQIIHLEGHKKMGEILYPAMPTEDLSELVMPAPSLEQCIAEFLAKGGMITRVIPKAKSFSSGKIDVDALLEGLDNPAPSQEAEPLEQDFDEPLPLRA